MKKMKEFLKKHKKLCIAAVILAVVLAAAGSFVTRARKAKEMLAMAPVQETAQVERRSLMETVSATGTVVSAQSKSVSVSLSGVEVLEVNVEVGDSVEAGDVICVLDSTDLEEDLADAQTTLNATAGKTAVDVASAERGLSEAQTSRDIETARAYEDEDAAYEDYLESLTDEEEAENDWREAQEATISKNGEWEAAKEKLEDAEDDMDDAEEEMEKLASAAGKASGYASEFSNAVGELASIIPADAAVKDVKSFLYIENAELSSYTAADFVDSSRLDADSNVVSQVEEYLGTLKGLQDSYNTAQKDQAAYEAASAAYQEAQTAYQEAQSEASSWESKYNSAKNSETSYENAYDQAISNSESKYDAYEQKVRSTEDTIRNNDSSVSSKEDSLTNSQLNASTSGLSDKQQIRQLEEQIEDCTVKAPINGVITSLNVEVGDTYSGTDSSAIAVIENIDSYEVEAEIDEYDISLIKVGQQVVVKTNGTGDTELDGTVTAVAPRATTAGTSTAAGSSSSDASYKVTVSIDTPCDDLRMDMTAKLSIIIESKEDVLTVPYDAVQEADDGTYYVEVVSDSASRDASAATGQTGSADEVSASRGEAAGQDGETSAAGNGETDEEEDQKTDDMPQNADTPGENSEMPQGTAGQMPSDKGGNMSDATAASGRRVTIEKGIESDYYIEIVSDEITEGMEVIVPASEDSGMDFRGMAGMQGPMGGF